MKLNATSMVYMISNMNIRLSAFRKITNQKDKKMENHKMTMMEPKKLGKEKARTKKWGKKEKRERGKKKEKERNHQTEPRGKRKKKIEWDNLVLEHGNLNHVIQMHTKRRRPQTMTPKLLSK